MSLIAEGLKFDYPLRASTSLPALDAVSFSLEPGELVIVVGATGSGKSTLLRLCAGLLKPDSGSVLVDGGPVDAKGIVGIVFQNPETQFFAESVHADVAFGPRNLGLVGVDTAVDDSLSAVGLDPVAFGPRSPFTLSGGEARRVAIAGILAMRTPYLLLDEPTAGLDPLGRNAVLKALGQARQRAGVLVVTHDAGEFLGAADRIIALSEGRIAFSGKVSELLDDSLPWEHAGLALPPIVSVQLAARDRGLSVGRVTLDPVTAARSLVRAAGERT